ncbi:hypothetical protein RA11412_0268 [Rothia aeria]|uniref:Uncharacterized protein n=1 Tax=Rothia aeria TaxID=172042 RepID=A0A2Z5QVY2_9MICC|nr:hypothetical protein RA11412_0268 [Rothia aeria]
MFTVVYSIFELVASAAVRARSLTQAWMERTSSRLAAFCSRVAWPAAGG